MADNNWTTPTRDALRSLVQNSLKARGITVLPNDWPAIIGEIVAGMASLNLQFLDFLSDQFLPLTANAEFLDKHATLYLTNSDNSQGRKVATYASGTASMTSSIDGIVLPSGSQFTVQANDGSQIVVESIGVATISTSPTEFPIRSLDAGAAGNIPAGYGLTLTSAVSGLNDESAEIVSMAGGADTETDDALRARVLFRLKNIPMSGASADYESWATDVAGVTRAWCAPNEIGAGTVTIRIMCDEIAATDDPLTTGQPPQAIIDQVRDFITNKRPVTAKVYVVVPIPEPVNIVISNLDPASNLSVQNAIAASVAKMIYKRARPAQAINGTLRPPQTISLASISSAISNAPGVNDFDVRFTNGAKDFVPSTNGSIAVMGQIEYE